MALETLPEVCTVFTINLWETKPFDEAEYSLWTTIFHIVYINMAKTLCIFTKQSVIYGQKFLSRIMRRGRLPVASSHLQIFDSTVRQWGVTSVTSGTDKSRCDYFLYHVLCGLLSKGLQCLEKSFLLDFQGFCADGTSVKISL